MPAPTNISFATATDLGTLTVGVPVTVTAVADFGGVTYNLFYKFTAPTTTNTIYAFAYGDASVYRPRLQPYDAAEASILAINSNNNCPAQFPVTGGTLNYVQVVKNGTVSPANLTLTVIAHEPRVAPLGSILVPDANNGFPAAVLSSSADYTALRFIPGYSSSEQGDILASGVNLMQTDTTVQTITLRDAQMETIVVHNAQDVVIRACLEQNVFYVAIDDGGASPIVVKTVDEDGTLTTVDTMTGVTNVEAIAASNDGTLLYHATNGVSPAVKVWDLVGHAALPDLVAGINQTIGDIIVLRDDTLLVNYRTGSPVTMTVKHYSAAGATLHTYTITTNGSTVQPRIATAVDDVSFWAWYADDSTTVPYGQGLSHIKNIQISDGTVLIHRTNMSYGAGGWTGTATATPPGTFGHDNSCPFMILRQTLGVTTTTYPIRRQRRMLLPSSPANRVMRIPVLELLMRTGIGLTAGPSGSPVQGEDPMVMWRISKDGGKTWGHERWTSAGAIGNYANRVRLTRATGNYRNAVLEVTVSDPVDWQFLAMLAPDGVIEGTS